MSKYSSKPQHVSVSAPQAYAKLTDIKALQSKLDELPEDVRSKMGDMKFTDDEIVIGTPQVGNIVLRATERRAPELIRFEAQGSPVPISMSIHIAPETDSTATVEAAIELDIPAMLRPLVGGKMQEAASKFGETLALIVNSNL